MDARVARNIAHYSHLQARDRFGDPVIDHVERVARAVPEQARAVAFLHDVLEQSATTADELFAQGLTPDELAALDLLTRSGDESYELHALRIAWAAGDAGELARCVKLADLTDHLSHASTLDDAPPYAWALRHIRAAQERRAGLGVAA